MKGTIVEMIPVRSFSDNGRRELIVKMIVSPTLFPQENERGST